jgi:hypothetical protein
MAMSKTTTTCIQNGTRGEKSCNPTHLAPDAEFSTLPLALVDASGDPLHVPDLLVLRLDPFIEDTKLEENCE